METQTESAADPMRELDAMRAVATALSGLPREAVSRILRWIAESHGVEAPASLNRESDREPLTSAAMPAGPADGFLDIAEVFSAASPRSSREAALVGGFWFQTAKGQTDFDAFSLNRELKHLGHGASNITAALSALMTQRPQLVIQTKKTGKSFQARKRYRLTQEGVARVQSMIAGNRSKSEG